MSDNISNGSFAYPGRPPQNHRGDFAVLQSCSQNASLPREVLLTDQFIQVFGSESFCQRS